MNDPRFGPVIVAARRTPIGTAGGAFQAVPVEDLAAPVLRAVVADAGAGPENICEVVLGNVMGPGGNPARVSALAAGLGIGVAGLTVDQQCASGLAAINMGAALVASGRAEFLLAGGVESVSTAPWRAARPASASEPPRFYSRARFAPDEFGDLDMGVAADLVAAEAGVSRRRQDEYAARSHALATATQRSGCFDREIVPIGGRTLDQRPRDGLDVRRLSRFPSAFSADGTATAGNSCGVNDGAAAVAVVSDEWRANRRLPGLRVVDTESVGVDPKRPGLGPVSAIRNLLWRNKIGLDDISVLEFNEAFAGQVLSCLDDLGFEVDRVCPGGGAIALGHPWGASGAVLMVRLFSQLVGAGKPGAYGLAAIASGGGLGVATLVQAVGEQ